MIIDPYRPRQPEIPEVIIQRYLGDNLHALGLGQLQLVGLEYPVPTGRIDILAKRSDGRIYVIEVKRSVVRREAVGQIQAYIGHVREQWPWAHVQGILVAADIDAAAAAALTVTPGVEFWSYEASFSFSRRNGEAVAVPPKGTEGLLQPPFGAFPETFIRRRCPLCQSTTQVAKYANGALRCTECNTVIP